MKKLLPLIFVLTISSIVSCSEGSGHENNAGNNLYYSMLNYSSSESIVTFASSASSSSREEQSIINGLPFYSKIDYDFTTLDDTTLQSTFLSMNNYPEEYLNKIVKVSGPFLPYGSTNPDLCYPAIFLFGNDYSCCAYCFEFLLYGVPVCSPEGGNGYPLLREEATIVGRFDKYYEGSDCYIHLVDAIWLKE